MATAMIGGLIKRGTPATQLSVVEIDAAARTRLQTQFGVVCHADYAPVAAADTLILAVKPQQLAVVAKSIAPRLREQLVISIAAGIRTQDLSRWLGGYARIVRVMPNTPALVLAGISGMYAVPQVDAAQRQRAEAILKAVGEAVWVPREEDIDTVTALSGSGPAYVFYFIEALLEGAARCGLDAATARALALHTVSGAAKLALEASEPPATLRERVTSKGGTTERALQTLEQREVKQAIAEAVIAAAARSRELGDVFGAAQ